MSQTEIEATHQTCPRCNAREAFTIFAGGYRGYCHSSCGNVTLKEKEVKPVVKGEFRPVRGISAETAQLFGIQTQIDEDGNPVRYAFKYPETIKYRLADEKKFWIKDAGVKLVSLFGPNFNAGSSKRIYLTEGEFDAAALYEVLSGSYPVKSVPSGAKGGVGEAFLKANYDYLNSFSEIALAFDNDKPGQEAAAKFYAAFPEKTYKVSMTKHKDANAFLMAGDSDDLKWAALKPQRYTPENFWVSEDQIEELLKEPPYEYMPTGHGELDEVIRGLTKGCMTTILAQEGIGKSELIGYFEWAVLQNDPIAKVAIMHLEEQKSVVVGRLASYAAQENLKYAAGSDELRARAMESLRPYIENERLCVLDMRAEDDPYALLDHIRVAHAVYGCQYIFVDHIHQVADQDTDNGDDERKVLDKLSSRLARMARDLQIAIIIISHVNDDGKTRSSRMIRKQAGIVIDLARDLTHEDDEIRNTTTMTCSKNRPWGKTGPCGYLRYDSETNTMSEAHI